jgi:hypothetical protein
MSFQKSAVLLSIFILLFLNGCGAPETPTNTANTNSVNANVARANAENPLATTRKAEEATVNQAETIKPVVMAYYEALKKKDDAGLRKVYSRETLKYFEADMKSEGAKSLVEFITELEPAPEQPFQVRNEQIQGDTAIAEIRGGAYPNGIKIKFVRENGEWKITNESPDIQAVKQSATNSAR